VAVRLVDFLGAGLAVVLLVDLTVVLVVGFTVALLAVVFAGVLLAVRGSGFTAEGDALRAVVFDSADASINGFVFLDGSVARTCLIALACSSSVILNSWWPSRLATK
jgi:hypothetical protein